MKILTNGCFDILHYGHIVYLETCKTLVPDAHLIVAINSDASVKKLKGLTRPLQPEAQRAHCLLALTVVDEVIIFNETRINKLLKNIQPDVWIKGGDYTLESLDQSERHLAESLNIEIKFTGLIPGVSTTRILSKL